jgi:predicted alpha-1,2-mannosidase
MRLTLLLLFLSQMTFAQSNYVNPFIGTGGHGHTFPGAAVPFGMVQLSPDTRIDGSWDGCSGYHYSDTFLYGFSHTHLSGTGVSDYGDILLLPSMNPISFEQEEYKTLFSHDAEIAKANYYEVQLPENGVKVRLTTDTWTGLHQYIFDNSTGYVLLDLKHRDKTLDFKIVERGNYTVEGYRISEGWAKEQHCYFSMDFSAPYTSVEYNADSSKAVLYFEDLKNNTLESYVGISFTSVEGARKNLYHDIRMSYEWPQFDEKRIEGQARWDSELSKIEVFTEDEDKKRIFYTALYHCMLHPNIAEDVDGRYRGHDGQIHESPNHTQHTVFSLWDTYRALHPLMTIIDEQRTTDFINSFLEIYKQSGRLPVWELASNETDCMIGYHSVSVIADAYMKGIRGFDTTLALEAMVASANEDIFGLPSYRAYGFVRAEDESESVSKTLEYAYDDWCIAQMAREMGADSIADVFYRRAESWRNSINPETGFATPRLNGDWLPNFDPKEVNLHFTEANSWQYSFVQQASRSASDRQQLEKQLDAFFSASNRTTGRTQSDITGLIGQYAHGNEPSHHIVYLYNHLAQGTEKTTKLVDQICDSFYTNAPDGLIGNEDCGQMSAWYVFSASGFYPSNPGSNQYAVGSCQFDSVKFNLENGKTFWVKKPKLRDTQAAVGVSGNFENHTRIKEGEMLLFSDSNMGKGRVSFSTNTEPKIMCPTPLIRGNSIFTEEANISIKAINPGDAVYCFINGDTSTLQLYLEPFRITETIQISAFAKTNIRRNTRTSDSVTSLQSPIISAAFYKKPNNWTCTPSIDPNSQYTGGGEDALIDGIKGTANWQAGRWQGYQNTLVTFYIDFKKTKSVEEVKASFVQDARSWIVMPSKVEVYRDGKLVGSTIYLPDVFTEGNFLETITVKLDKSTPRSEGKIKTNKLQIKIYSAGKLPKGHQGYSMDGDAFFFVDELIFR